MSDAPDATVPDHLRERFGRLDSTLAELRAEQREQRGRIGAIERSLAHVEREAAAFRARSWWRGPHSGQDRIWAALANAVGKHAYRMLR
jgi:hypothetical protein